MHHRACDLGQASVLIAQTGEREILHLRIVMHHIGKHCHYRFRKPALQPVQHVNMMHRMIQGRAAALLLPGSSPPQVIIAMSSPPCGLHLCQTDFPRQITVQRLFQPVNGIPETVLGDTGHGHAVTLLGLQHPVALRKAGGHRLFHHHITSLIHTVHRNLTVNIGRRAHMHKIDFDSGIQHGVMVRKHLTVQLIFFLHGLRLFRINIAQSHHPAPVREGQQTSHMYVCNISCSHDRYIDHSNSRTFLLF